MTEERKECRRKEAMTIADTSEFAKEFLSNRLNFFLCEVVCCEGEGAGMSSDCSRDLKVVQGT